MKPKNTHTKDLLDSKGKPIRVPAPPRSLARPEHVIRAIGTVARMLWRDEISATKALALGSLLKAIMQDQRAQERQMIDSGAEPITEVRVVIGDAELEAEIRAMNEDILDAPVEEDEFEDEFSATGCWISDHR